MGFFKNLMKNLFANKIGVVTGSDFNGGYLATGRKNGVPALAIFGHGEEDYLFTKDDVKEFGVYEQNARFLIDNNAKIGNKYRILFKDGKSAIFNVPAGDCAKVEAILF